MDKFTFFIFIFSILIISFTGVVNGVDEDFFIILDPVGDDYGPGTYKYPTADVFKTEKGLFDITAFRIKDEGDDYLLHFSFTKLIDPWQSKFGFSLPLIELYIDNQSGGSTELFKPGANVRLAADYPWDTMIKISGWWLRAFQPVDRNQKDDSWDQEESQWDVKTAQVKTEGNEILVHISKNITGKLENSHIFLLVGGFDPFGPDYYRQITAENSDWAFADLGNTNIKNAPRVIDLVLPENKKQAELLADFKSDYPVIYPIRIKEKGRVVSGLNKYSYLFLILIIPLLYIIRRFWLMHKRKTK